MPGRLGYSGVSHTKRTEGRSLQDCPGSLWPGRGEEEGGGEEGGGVEGQGESKVQGEWEPKKGGFTSKALHTGA